MSVVRWGLIGCGDISRKRVAPALRDMPECELVAVNRARAELAEEFAREFGARRWYDDWRELLNDPEIDAVYIATPVDLHAEQAVAAAEAGKHVLCEKPMALTAAECDRMIAAAEVSGVRMGIAYYRHFYPVIRRMKELIGQGGIGIPVLAQVEAFEMFDRVPGEDRFWLLERERSGGGPMMDFGCHRIEALINLLGPIRETVAIDAQVRFARQVEDTAVATFRFDSGALGTLTVTHAAWESRDTVRVFGSEGSLHVPVLNGAELIIRGRGGERTEHHPPHANIHLPSIADFVTAIREERSPQVDGHLGREVARIEDEVYRR